MSISTNNNVTLNLSFDEFREVLEKIQAVALDIQEHEYSRDIGISKLAKIHEQTAYLLSIYINNMENTREAQSNLDKLRNMKQDSLRKTRQIATYAENYYGAMARLQHHNDLATEKDKDYLAISNKWTDVKERIEVLLK